MITNCVSIDESYTIDNNKSQDRVSLTSYLTDSNSTSMLMKLITTLVLSPERGRSLRREK